MYTGAGENSEESEPVIALPPVERMELYRAGIELQLALQEFPDIGLIQEYRRLTRTPPPALEVPAIPADLDFDGRVAAVMRGLDPRLKHSSAIANARSALERHTLAALREGQAVGIGYSVPRQPADPPNIVPSDMWEGKVDWWAGKVRGNGLEFVSVRVIDASMVDYGNNPGPSRPVGRPSSKAEIFAAYDALKAAGKIDFGASMTPLYSQIRSWLVATYPDRAGMFGGFSDEAIRRVITAEFKADRDSNKQ